MKNVKLDVDLKITNLPDFQYNHRYQKSQQIHLKYNKNKGQPEKNLLLCSF